MAKQAALGKQGAAQWGIVRFFFMVTINSSLNDEQVELICLEYGCECEKHVPVDEVNFENKYLRKMSKKYTKYARKGIA